MEKYPKYKDSGIEWIGEIPEHWEVKKFRFLFDLITDKGKANNVQVGLENIESWTGKYLETGNKFEGKGISFYQGDILFGKLRPYLAKVFLANFSGNAVGDFFVFRVKKDWNSSYASKFIISKNFIDIVNSSTFGSKMPRVSWGFISDLKIPSAPKQEQQKIATYLDQKTQEIDDLIQQKEQLLQLYEEEKTAIINQAVTKGINPKVKLKDSGIEWLGEIPVHWAVKKLKYVAKTNPSNINKKSKETERKIFLCNYVDVYKNDYISNELSFMKATATDVQIEKFILKKGDVIATKDSESPDDIAVPALVVCDFQNVVCGYHLTHIKPFRIKGSFLFRFFQTAFLKSYFEISANGVTRYGIGVNKFNSAMILHPNNEEQAQIVTHIQTETARIDTKVTQTKKLIDLLKEYKTALISEVVTGKIKIV